MSKNLKKSKNSIVTNKNVRMGTISTSITVLVLALIVAVNIVVSAFSDKFTSTFDLTANQAFNITDESAKFVSSIDKKVEITVLNTEKDFIGSGDYYLQANQVIKQYAKHSSKINVKYVDVTKNPNIASQYPEDNVETNSIIMTCGDKYRILSASDIFDVSYTYSGAAPTASNAEQAMTSALMYLTSGKQTKISVLTGYDETDASGFVSVLKNNNFEVIKQAILTENIDSDTSLAIIFAPKRDYDSATINKLNSFLSQDGKSILYVAGVDQGSLPNIDSFLKNWGIKIGTGTVFETSQNKLLSSTIPFYNISEYVDEEFSSVVKNQSIPVTIPYSRPLEILDKNITRVLLQSSETSGVIPAEVDDSWTLSDNDIKGFIPTAVMSTKTANNKTANVVVAGSTLAFDTQFLSMTGLNNSSYFIGALNKLTNRNDAITIESKTLSGQSLGITALQANIIGIYVFTLGLPLVVIIIGIIVWIRRRNK